MIRLFCLPAIGRQIFSRGRHSIFTRGIHSVIRCQNLHISSVNYHFKPFNTFITLLNIYVSIFYSQCLICMDSVVSCTNTESPITYGHILIAVDSVIAGI